MRVHYFRDFIPVATRLRNAIDCRMHHLIAIAFNFKLLSRTRTRFSHQPCNVLEELAPMVVNAALIAIGETFPRSNRCRSSSLTIGKTFAHFIVGTKSLLTHVLTLSWENFRTHPPHHANEVAQWSPHADPLEKSGCKQQIDGFVCACTLSERSHLSIALTSSHEPRAQTSRTKPFACQALARNPLHETLVCVS